METAKMASLMQLVSIF